MPPARRAQSPARASRPTSSLKAEEIDGSTIKRWHDGKFTAAARKGNATGEAPRSLVSRAASEICSVFLPVGYPSSVRPEYLRFQAFDTLQAACSYLRNILTTSAILRGAGVGEDAASPMAAAIAWVLRDGFGMFGSLVFSYLVGTGFDRNVKEWRLFADVINDVGLTLDMLAPLAGPSGGTNFMVVAALGACCKTICGMTAGATRASITSHFALHDNLADVSAKEGAQETAVTLLGLLVGGALANRLGDSPMTSWAAFLTLTLVHVWANCIGVGCLAFTTLNRQRAAIVTRAWWSDAHATIFDKFAPSEVARAERIWGPLRLWLFGPRIGVGMGDLVDLNSIDGGAADLQMLGSVYRGHEYVDASPSDVPWLPLVTLGYPWIPLVTLGYPWLPLDTLCPPHLTALPCHVPGT